MKIVFEQSDREKLALVRTKSLKVGSILLGGALSLTGMALGHAKEIGTQIYNEVKS